ncbi:hypothetical protein MCOL2_07861, partial [Listeria fleischmannii FSL S10-1203]
MQWTDVLAEIQRFGSRNYMRMVYASKKHEEEAFWAKQKSRIELFYHYNYIGIHSFIYTKTHKLPTGTYVIEGYVNDNPQLSFNANADLNTNFEGEGGESAELSEMVKPEYAAQTKSVSQILKEKKQNQSHQNELNYSQMITFFMNFIYIILYIKLAKKDTFVKMKKSNFSQCIKKRRFYSLLTNLKQHPKNGLTL